MSIIRIHLYRPYSAQQQKYLLTYIPQIHSTIRSFVDFAINALDIKQCCSDNLVIENDGYTIPFCLDGKILQKITTLTIKVKPSAVIDHKKPAQHITNSWMIQKPSDKLSSPKQPQSQQQVNQHPSQSIQQQHHHDQQSQSTPKFSQDGLADRNKKQIIIENLIKKKQTNKVNQQISKHKKAQQLKAKIQLNKADKKQKKIEQQQQSQQSPQQIESEKVKDKKKAPELKKGGKKVQSFKKQSSQQSSESEQQQQQSPQQKESLQQQQRSGSESSSQSSQSSEEELPRVVRTKKAQLKQKVQEKHQQKKPEFVNQKSKIQNSRQFPVTYANRKKLIQADDIESSDSSSYEGQSKLKAKLTNIKPNLKGLEVGNVNNNNNNKKTIIEKQKQHISAESKSVAKMIPPALRNKSPALAVTTAQKSSLPVLSPFKQHQLQQWILITPQILTLYRQSLPQSSKQLPFLKPNNLIKFKQIQLDEEKFIPKQSQWIEGTVQNVDEKDGKIVLVKVSQLGKEYRDRMDVYEYNMVVLEVNRNYLTPEQSGVVGVRAGKEPTTQQHQQQQKPQPQSQQQQQPLSTISDKTSLQKFICGQVNYYFSQKNYPFDLFMQMHANKHPQKYIPIRFLLNFPKIKKVLKDENKLLQYLVEDEKQPQRNFQIDSVRKLVRKKIVEGNAVGEGVVSQGQKQDIDEKGEQKQ